MTTFYDRERRRNPNGRKISTTGKFIVGVILLWMLVGWFIFG